MLSQVNAHYCAFYPADGDPDHAHDAGLLRPRFGLPAIAQAGHPFTIEWLERGGPESLRAALLAPEVSDADAERCLAGRPGRRLPPGRARARRRARPRARRRSRPPPPRPTRGRAATTCTCTRGCDAPTRAPRAVWLRADDPAHLGEVHVVQLSDHPHRQARPRRREAPRAGDRRDQRAQAGPRRHHRRRGQPGAGRVVAARGAGAARGDRSAGGHRARQPRHRLPLVRRRPLRRGLAELRAQLSLVPRVRDRPRRLSLRRVRLGAVDAVAAHPDPRAGAVDAGAPARALARPRRTTARRGVVLFSHAPSRAVLSGRTPASGGAFGHMLERARRVREAAPRRGGARRARPAPGRAHPLERRVRRRARTGAAEVRALARRRRRRQADADPRARGDGDDAGGDARRPLAEAERARLRLHLPRARRRRPASSPSIATAAGAAAAIAQGDSRR